MRIAMTLTAAVLALAASANVAAAQRESGGGGTIGCDPGLPTALTSATQCRTFFKEELYGPCANPYAAPWQDCAAAPVVRRHKATKHRSNRKSTTSGGSAY
jgi:hypothetical protein